MSLFFKDFRPRKDGSDNQMITFPEAEIIEKFPVALGLRIMPVAIFAATCYQSL